MISTDLSLEKMFKNRSIVLIKNIQRNKRKISTKKVQKVIAMNKLQNVHFIIYIILVYAKLKSSIEKKSVLNNEFNLIFFTIMFYD